MLDMNLESLGDISVCPREEGKALKGQVELVSQE